MTRLSPDRFPWTGSNVLICSVVVVAGYVGLKLRGPLSALDSPAVAMASTALLAAAFILPPAMVLLLGWLRARRAGGGPPGPDGAAARPVSFDPRELWLTRGALSRDVIAGVVLGLLLALMNGISIQRGIDEFLPGSGGALGALVWRSSGLGAVSTLLLALGVVAPAAEEVFFRGVLYAGLRKRLPVLPAVVLSAGVFASAHLDSMRAHAFLLGLVAALLLEYTGSLVPAVLAHMGVNIGFVLFLANRGLLAREMPSWGVIGAFIAMNVLFFALGQPLFGEADGPAAPPQGDAPASAPPARPKPPRPGEGPPADGPPTAP